LDFFKHWTPLSAYYLGYVVADGTVTIHSRRYYKLKLKCQERDRSLIEGFKQTVGSAHKLTRISGYVDSRGRKNGPSVQLQLTSDPFARVLVELHGILPNKSELDLPLPSIPDDLFAHFARGLLDGDGCVSRNKTSGQTVIYWKGSHLAMQQLQDRICGYVGLPGNKILKDSETLTISKVAWYAKDHLRMIYEWMYPAGDHPFLARKKDRIAVAVRGG